MIKGDKIRMKNLRSPKTVDNTLYEIISVHDSYVKVKHPSISGYFIFAKKNISEVISDNS